MAQNEDLSFDWPPEDRQIMAKNPDGSWERVQPRYLDEKDRYIDMIRGGNSMLAAALRTLLSCAELNQDDLEPETREAVAAARRLLGE